MHEQTSHISGVHNIIILTWSPILGGVEFAGGLAHCLLDAIEGTQLRRLADELVHGLAVAPSSATGLAAWGPLGPCEGRTHCLTLETGEGDGEVNELSFFTTPSHLCLSHFYLILPHCLRPSLPLAPSLSYSPRDCFRSHSPTSSFTPPPLSLSLSLPPSLPLLSLCTTLL